MYLREIKIYFAKTEKTDAITTELETHLNRWFGGYTVYSCRGGYIGELLEYEEESLVYEVITNKKPFNWKHEIRVLFSDSGEESILITEKTLSAMDYICI